MLVHCLKTVAYKIQVFFRHRVIMTAIVVWTCLIAGSGNLTFRILTLTLSYCLSIHSDRTHGILKWIIRLLAPPPPPYWSVRAAFQIRVISCHKQTADPM
jgi:hypothetical protein